MSRKSLFSIGLFLWIEHRPPLGFYNDAKVPLPLFSYSFTPYFKFL